MQRSALSKSLVSAGLAGLIVSCLLATSLRSAKAALALNWVDRGLVAMQLGRYDDAILSFTSAIDAEQSVEVALYDRARAYWLTGRLPQADADLTRAILLRPSLAQAYDLRARVRDGQGDLAAALIDAARATSLAGDIVANRLTYASLLDKANRTDDAATQYEIILHQTPQTPVALRNLAAIRLAQHRSNDALVLLRRLDNISPNDADAATDTATVLLSEHRYAEALAWINAHANNMPRMAELSARALYGLHNNSDALAVLPEPTTADSSETRRFRGLVLLANHRCADAAEALHLAAATNDSDAVLWRDTGTADLCAHNRSSAITAFTKSLEIDPTDSFAHRYLADALRESGTAKDAISEYRIALRRGGPNAYVLKTVGVLEYLQGQHTQGRADFAAGCTLLEPGEDEAIQDCRRQLPHMRR